MNAKFCSCGASLTREEVEFYSFRCEDCELAELVRIELWRRGAEDQELDDAFGGQDESCGTGRAH